MSMMHDRAVGSTEMLAIFADKALLRAALRFEAGLARAEAAEGIVLAEDAARIHEVCESFDVDIETLADEAAHAGTMAIPLVNRLRARVAEQDKAAAEKVHLGATSQDLADTALMLQAKAGSTLIEGELLRIGDALSVLAGRHKATPMLGRTLLQGALPITFGLRAANWLLGIDDALTRFRRERDDAIVLQLGGAAGTLAGFSGKAFAVTERMARDLGLICPPIPWHARRGNIAGLAAALGIVTGVVGKIARDISLMAQNEIGEAFEPISEGRGGSSALVHKRNPTGCQQALSAALRAPGLVASILAGLPQEQERGLGGWQAEAPVLSELFVLADGALRAMLPVVEGLDVNADAMAHNLAAANMGSDFGEAEALAQRALDRHGKIN